VGGPLGGGLDEWEVGDGEGDRVGVFGVVGAAGLAVDEDSIFFVEAVDGGALGEVCEAGDEGARLLIAEAGDGGDDGVEDEVHDGIDFGEALGGAVGATVARLGALGGDGERLDEHVGLVEEDVGGGDDSVGDDGVHFFLSDR
jgi:hypothetical protein